MSKHGTGRWRRTQVPVADLIARFGNGPREEFGLDPKWVDELTAMQRKPAEPAEVTAVAEQVEQDATDRLMGLPEAMLTEQLRPVAGPVATLAATGDVVSGVLDAAWLALAVLFAAGGVA